MNCRRRLSAPRTTIGVFITCILLTTGGQAAEFIPLGNLSGGDLESRATDASDDGSVVVGVGNSSDGLEAFRWTAETGMVGLGDFPGGSHNSQAFGVSGDGSTVVGHGNTDDSTEAFRWTIADKMIGLGDLSGSIFESIAEGASADGSVVVGRGFSVSGNEAFRWTSEGGMVGLGDLQGGGFSSRANAVSVDGSVVVGQSESTTDNREAFRWTEEGGMIGLGALPGGEIWSQAHDVSANGSVVVGSATGTNDSEAFRWTSDGGMVGLGAFPDGEFYSVANAVSADGNVVVGDSRSAAGWEGFVWTEANGMVKLYDLLVANGATGLSDWGRLRAYGISGNGKWVVGKGINPSGTYEAFLARIDEYVSPDFEINAGLNDAWFNLASSGQGFLITVFPDIKQIFLAWFTYDTERPPEEVTAMLGEPGHRWLTAQGPYDGDTANLTIFVTKGGIFDAAEPVAETDPAGDGTMTLEFADCTEGLVSYEIASLDISGEIPIQRISPDNVALCESL